MTLPRLMRTLLIVLCGIVLGFIVITAVSHRYRLFVPKELLKPGVFGNISIKLMKLGPSLREELNVAFKENPQKEALWFFVGQRVFAIVPMFANEKIRGFAVMDEIDRILAASRLSNGAFSDLQVMPDNDARHGGLHLMPCEEPAGLRLYYTKAQDGTPCGETYTDIDFDGQFDIKMTFDQKEKVIHYWISIDKQWEKVDWCKSNGTAGFGTRGEKVSYRFEPNKGWNCIP